MSGKAVADDVQSILRTARRQKFTGVIQLSAGSGAWHVCVLLGQITWIASRLHGLRRWERSLKLYIPVLANHIEQREHIQNEVWNYSALTLA